MKPFAFLLAIVLLSTGCSTIPDNRWKDLHISVRVFDEKGKPMPGAEVKGHFNLTALQMKRSGRSVNTFNDLTSESGLVQFESRSSRYFHISVSKDGYHPSGGGYEVSHADRIDEGKTRGTPNGTYKKEIGITLRRLHEPKPLFAKRASFRIPVLGQPIGYDLEVGDLVQPHGNGVHSDFIFNVTKETFEAGGYRAVLNLSFSRPEDGLQYTKKDAASSSILLLESEAPSNGYLPSVTVISGFRVEPDGTSIPLWDPDKPLIESIEGAWFRVRSSENTEGGMSHRFGRMEGVVEFSANYKTLLPKIEFRYLFSPDTSRNVEWNGENLIDVERWEQIFRR